MSPTLSFACPLTPTAGDWLPEPGFAGSTSIVARHVTVVGTGDAVNAGRGAYANAYNAGDTVTLDVRDSIFHALSTDLQVASSSGGIARIAVSHSNFDPAKVLDVSAGDAQVNAGDARPAGQPRLRRRGGGRRSAAPRLAAHRPGLQRAGRPVHLDGLPRPNDGNGDGAAVRDIGAPSADQRAPDPPPAAHTSAPLFKILSGGLKLDRRGRVALVLRGLANETAASSASAGLRSVRRLGVAQRKRRVALGRTSFSLQPSARTVVRLKLTRKNVRRVRRMRKLSVTLAVTASDAAGNARTVRKRVTLRAQPKRR